MADGVVIPWRSGGGAKPAPAPKPSPLPVLRQVQAQRATAARGTLPTQTADGAIQLPWRQRMNTETAKAAKQVDAGRKQGLLGQVGTILEKTPSGLGHFVGQAVHDTVVSPAYEIKRGIQHPFGGGQVEHRPELHKEIGQSFARTASDVRHPGQYVEAYHQGQLVGKVLEDLANASLVGSLATAPVRSAVARSAAEAAATQATADQALALGIRGPALDEVAQRAAAAGARAQQLAPYGRAADIVHSAVNLGAQGANLPIKPIEYLGKGLKTLGETEIRGVPIAARLAENPITRSLGEARDVVQARQTAKNLIADEARLPKREAQHALVAAAHEGSAGLTKFEDQASTLIFDKVLADPRQRALVSELDARDPAGFDSFVRNLNERLPREDRYAPESVRMALDFHEGRLDPEVAANIERGVQAQATMSPLVSEVQADRGRLTPLDPEQLGTELLTSKTTAHPTVLARREAADQAMIEEAKQAKRLGEVEARETEQAVRTQAARERAVGRIEGAGERQVKLEARRQRLAATADELWQRADEARLAGDVKAARAAEDAAVRAGKMEEASAARVQRLVEQRNVEGHVASAQEYAASRARTSAAAEQRLGVAAEEAARNEYLRSAGPTPLGNVNAPANEASLRAAERRVGRRFEQGLGQEETAARLGQREQGSLAKAADSMEKVIAETQRHEGVVQAAEGVRAGGEAKATRIAEAANDAAEVLGTRAQATEATHATLAGEAPLREGATEQVGRASRAGEQLGARAEKTAAARGEAEAATRAREKAQQAVADELQKRFESLDAVPARYRYAVASGRDLATAGSDLVASLRSQGADFAADQIQALVDDLPTTLKDFVDAGIDPAYLPGGRDPLAIHEGRRGLSVKPTEHSLRQRKLKSELERQTEVRPTTVAGRARIAAREIDRAVQNRATSVMLERYGVDPYSVGVDVVAEPGLLKDGGAELRARMQEKGYEPIDPRLPDSTPSTVDGATKFVPKDLKREFGNYFKPESTYEALMRSTFDPIRRGWKDMVLPVSGRWHVGNVISNMVMNTIGTGSLAWTRELPEAWRAVRSEGHGVTGVPARVFGVQLERELDDWLWRRTGKDPSLVRRALNKSYALNTFVDDLSRSAVYLAEQRKGLASGMTAEQAQKEALRTSLKVSGDFSNMTEFERAYVRRAVPFYTWARHVTQLVSHLAVENPIRLVWTMHLADMFAPEGQGPFSDSISVGGKQISIGNLSPLGTFSNLYANPRGPGAGLLQSLGPELDVGAAALYGTNLGRGGQPLRMPPGQGRPDEFGNPINTPLLGRPRDLLSYATRQVPLVNTARQFREGQKLAEYDTGQPMLRGGKLIDSTPRIIGTNIGGRLGIVAGQLGVPVGTPFDVEQIKATAAKRRETQAKAAARYQKQLAKARKG